MVKTVAITCTKPRCDDIVARLQSKNIDAYAMPALTVRALDTIKPSGDYDTMLITSAHAIHEKLPQLPAIAVGTHTARLLQKSGHTVIQTGEKGVDDLDLSPYTSILYPCATQPTSIPEHCTPWSVYESVPNPDFKIHDQTDIIVCFSIKGAAQLSPSIVSTQNIICLSRAIADTLSWLNADRLAVCDQPDYDSLEQLLIEASQK
ncbi:MAG: hypothetical protein COB76_03350 [Alphaproteobacteria bacterium]|nr:MAG: hypothetical protein COB76_03350 [Alphaproteobacteria bacterium]